MTWTHRTFTVSYRRDGFFLCVADDWWLATVVSWTVENVLAALGHPCCGRGPLGRIPVLGLFWHRVLNLPVHLPHRSRTVVDLPLSDAQADLIKPGIVERMRDLDDE